MLRLLVLGAFALCSNINAAAVTFYEHPAYQGQSLTVAAANDATTALQRWSKPIQSITLDADTELVTYDRTERQGQAAIWRYSTTRLGSWTERVASFELRQADTEATVRDVNWKHLRVASGYVQVRATDTIECRSFDGVNCNVNLANTTSDNRGSVHPARCGAEHAMYWGVSGFDDATSWCLIAKAALAAPTTSWSCVPEQSNWLIVSSSSDGSRCVGLNICDRFGSLARCQDVASTLLGTDIVTSSHSTEKPATETIQASASSTTSAAKSGWVWGFPAMIAGCLTVGIVVAIKLNKQTSANPLEATYCSSIGGDDDLHV
ncbi:hypothetical protein SDRG_00036 [Saprolegnia diclina VS20]|uniref:Uncharacterized protein n=1 Tax=Saprolegnia diclina (strain VS20) TaxID=1156394 RepID=T0SH40_SAPDV|nr:hypothetical protein SDRG_00036 [Saprolegnia diclina VS20]EQC42297.1 hypothetical protein SDRG_00036 [Saprolegnia diclina VS20]|eukprot:XP_008603720.1 hypothetical protein SDRG_00036 [Saprolegnia diclina VS20]